MHAGFRANLHFHVTRIPVQLLPRNGMMRGQLTSDAEGGAVWLLQLVDDCGKRRRNGAGTARTFEV